MKSPIIITGAARSGTSMVAGVVHLCGVFGGDMSGPNRNNAKGMFENVRIRNGMVKPYLRELGVDPLGQYPLPDIKKLPVPVYWRKRIENIISTEGCKDNQPWMYKGAKACLMWPVWNETFPNAKWIIVRRRTGDIVNSCLKTAFMRAFHSPEVQDSVGVLNEVDGWIWWVRQHENRFVEMIQAGLNCKVVWPERMVQGDYEQLFETLEWLGLDYESHKKEIYNFIEPKLWKARRKK
jgi:hypothetical protein